MKKNNIDIREMKADDIKRVFEIESESFSGVCNIESFEYSLNAESDHCIVADCNGETVGYAIIRCSFETADIVNIAVAAKYRRIGIGNALVSKIIKYGFENGISEYALEVRTSNIPAISLYKKNGFEIEDIRKNYYSKPTEDAYVMWKR